MRKFYLHKTDKTQVFDLNGPRALATEPAGLGNQWAIAYNETDERKYVTNVKPEFETIGFKVYFNADGSGGYENFKRFADFVTSCGTELLLEYDDGITDKFAAVVLKNVPKGEIDEEGTLCSELTLERSWYWYEDVVESFALKSASKLMRTQFPLRFPFGFAGRVFVNEFVIQNQFFRDAPIVLTISGRIGRNIEVYIRDAETDALIEELRLSRGSADDTQIVVDAVNKKIEVTEAGQTVNGYGLQDPTRQSFLFLPPGRYKITSNMDDEDRGEIKVSIKRYLLD